MAIVCLNLPEKHTKAEWNLEIPFRENIYTRKCPTFRQTASSGMWKYLGGIPSQLLKVCIVRFNWIAILFDSKRECERDEQKKKKKRTHQFQTVRNRNNIFFNSLQEAQRWSLPGHKSVNRSDKIWAYLTPALSWLVRVWREFEGKEWQLSGLPGSSCCQTIHQVLLSEEFFTLPKLCVCLFSFFLFFSCVWYLDEFRFRCIICAKSWCLLFDWRKVFWVVSLVFGWW